MPWHILQRPLEAVRLKDDGSEWMKRQASELPSMLLQKEKDSEEKASGMGESHQAECLKGSFEEEQELETLWILAKLFPHAALSEVLEKSEQKSVWTLLENKAFQTSEAMLDQRSQRSGCAIRVQAPCRPDGERPCGFSCPSQQGAQERAARRCASRTPLRL